MFLGNAVKIALSGRNSQKDERKYENIHGKIRQGRLLRNVEYLY